MWVILIKILSSSFCQYIENTGTSSEKMRINHEIMESPIIRKG
jgi:hypothetical protein